MRVLISKNKRLLLYFSGSFPERPLDADGSMLFSDSLEGEFTGGDVLCDDRGYCGQGVAQGGIVIRRMESGMQCCFRIPDSWTDSYSASGYLKDIFRFDRNGHVPKEIEVHSTRPGHIYQPLVGSDDFCNGSPAGSLIMIQIHGTIIWMHCRNLYNYNTGSLYRALHR